MGAGARHRSDCHAPPAADSLSPNAATAIQTLGEGVLMALRKLRTVLLAGATVAGLAAVGVSASSVAASGASSVNWAKVTHVTATGPTSFANLVKAAKKEGRLNVVALPITGRTTATSSRTSLASTDIKINSENPEGSSAEEIQALTSDKGRATDPDVIDVGNSYAVTAKTEGLLAPYKVQTWSEIPSGLKQAKGYWFDDYGGFVAIGCDTKTVTTCPTSFKDMLTETGAEGYKIGLNNSPLTSNSALAAVEAAAIANGGSLDNVAPGVSFFATLNKNGAFVNTIADATTAQSGTTNVILWWDYLQANGGISVPGWTVTIPTDVSWASTTRKASTPTRRTPPPLVSGRSTSTRLLVRTSGSPVELAPQNSRSCRHTTRPTRPTWPSCPRLPKGQVPQFPTTAQITAAATVVNNTWAAQVGAQLVTSDGCVYP